MSIAPTDFSKNPTGPAPADNRVCVSLGAQRLQASEQQGFADMMPAPFRNNADRAEEIRTDHPMAAKPEQAPSCVATVHAIG